jgi:TP901 family phage tail tape measure protein
MAVKIPIVSVFDAKGLKQAERAFGDLKNNLMAATKVIAGVGLAVGGMAAISVKKFGDFDAALTQSTAIMGDLSAEMRKQMSDTARTIAKETTFSADQAAQAYFFLASAGLDAASSVAALPQVAKFAQAGMFDLALATDLLTDAQSALGMTIKDDAVANLKEMTRLSDVLVKANTLANASVEQFSIALTTKAGAALKILNKDVTEGVAVLAAFADQGIKGELAGTQLGIVLRDLTTKGIQNKTAFQRFGVEVFDTTGKMNNLGYIIGTLERALAGMSDETQKATLLQMGFSDKSLASLQALMGTSEAIQKYEEELRSASGFTDEVAGKQLNTFNAQLSLLASAFEDVAIEVGEKLTPYLQELIPIIKEQLPIAAGYIMEALEEINWEEFVKGIADSIGWLVENGPRIVDIGIKVATFVAILWTVDTVLKAVAAATALWNAALLMNPVTWVILGLAAITTGVLILKDALDKNASSTSNYRKELEKTFPPNNPAAYAFNQAGIQANAYRGILNNVALDTNNKIQPHQHSIRQIENAWDRAQSAIQLYRNTIFTGSGGTQDWLKAMGFGGFGSASAITPVFRPPVLEPFTPSSVSSITDDYEAISKAAIKEAEKAAAEMKKQAEAAAKALEKENNNAAKAAEEAARREEQILAERERVFKSFTDSVAGLFSNLKSGIMGAFELPRLGNSTNAIIRNMRKLLEATRTFSSNITRLSQMGLDPDLLQQVISAGPLAGARLASALVAGGSGAIAEISRGFSEFGGLASGIAMTGTQAAFATPAQQNVYNINISGGLATGADIGRVVVNAIKDYERQSGAAWRG